MLRRPIETLAVLLLCFASTGMVAATGALPASHVVPSDKGGFQYSEPTPFPDVALDLAPIEAAVASAASTRCGTPLAAAPLDLGDKESVMSQLAGKAASAAIGQLVGGLFGGGGSKEEPPLFKDPIKTRDKIKIEHPSGDARLQIGGQFFNDGMLISAKVDKSSGKGTFHTMFLERPDCTRIWPERYLGYGLWGSWSLSVSVTKTTSSYRNGELVDRSVSQSGWSKSGTFDFSRGFSLWDQLAGEDLKMVLDPDQAYLSQLKREIGQPAWQQMGFAEPTDGIRSAGGLFRVVPEDLTPGTIAVVHITQVEKGRYGTLGFPLDVDVGAEGKLAFEQLAPAQ